MNAHADKKAHLAVELAASAAEGTAAIGLAKKTSNLFRDRATKPAPKVNLSQFHDVIRVDPDAGVVEAEGMITYEALADATLRHGAMPAVVPQLKSITLGGAVAGVGIEASAFRRGLVHHTVAALEVLTGDGRIVSCTPDNEHRDLFFGFPNSYGTLGYALGVTARTIPVLDRLIPPGKMAWMIGAMRVDEWDGRTAPDWATPVGPIGGSSAGALECHDR